LGQERQELFFGLATILNRGPVQREEFLALYAKHDSDPVDGGNPEIAWSD
jgi:hypothetical protein